MIGLLSDQAALLMELSQSNLGQPCPSAGHFSAKLNCSEISSQEQDSVSKTRLWMGSSVILCISEVATLTAQH
jgi:hypothetical protein